MAHTLLRVIFAFLIVRISASPITSLQKRSFKVPRVEQKNYVPDGRAALKRAYLKHGLGGFALNPESSVESEVNVLSAAYAGAAAGTQDGETPAYGTQNDAQFLAPVKIGGQELILNFDTGSADLWVFSTLLSGDARAGRKVYDVAAASQRRSQTQANVPFNIEGGSFDIKYGDGSFASGDLVVDEVDIGGSTVVNQAIGVAKRVSSSFASDRASNGLVGLAFSTLSTFEPRKAKTFFENVVDDLSLPVFTAQLKGGTVGAYEFGRVDDSAYKGAISHIPIDTSQGQWEFKSEKVIVNGDAYSIAEATAIADTGTSLMLVPDGMLQHYWHQVSGATDSTTDGSWVFPCSAKLPDLQVAVGRDYMATVPGVFMNFAQVGPSDDGIPMCFGGLQSNQNASFAIYGDVWFKSQFVVFNATGPTLGVAPHS